jgi:Ser/Thr protein kinase RdoA (MazF antagonist)
LTGAVAETSSAAFAALGEAEQVARLETLLRRALVAWETDVADVSLLKYRENAVFSVSGGCGTRAVARVHRPGYRSDEEIRSELAWMRHLDACGVSTPAAIPTRDGDVVVTAAAPGVPEPRQCDLLAWVEGKPPGTLEGGVQDSEEGTRALYRTIGAVAARMHELAARWPRPPGFTRPSWNRETLVGESPTFGAFEDLAVLTAEQRRILVEARERVRSRLARLGPADMLIHGDLVPDNVLVDGGAIRVIDFDDLGWSWVGFEMATALFPLRVGGCFEAGLEGYLEGYRQVRPFPPLELEALPDLLLARGLSYLGWPVGRPEIASARTLAPLLADLLTAEAAAYLEPRPR